MKNVKNLKRNNQLHTENLVRQVYKPIYAGRDLCKDRGTHHSA